MLDPTRGSEEVLERNSPLPLYYQLKQILLRQIQDSEFPPGGALPTEKELEGQYGVSRITVRRALGELAAEGYISREVGRGTFVLRKKLEDHSGKLGGFADDLVAQGFRVESEILEYGTREAPLKVAEILHVRPGHSLFYFEKLVYADGEPIALTSAYINLGVEVTFTREELNVSSIYPLLEEKCGLVLRRADKTIEATVALDDEARLLQVAPGTLMLLAELIVYNERNRAKAFVKALYRGDRYKAYLSVSR